MKTEFYLVPIEHPHEGHAFVAWVSLAGMICVGEADMSTLTENSKLMAILKIHKDGYLPFKFTPSESSMALDDIVIYQLCGLKEILLHKFDKVFADAPAPMTA